MIAPGRAPGHPPDPALPGEAHLDPLGLRLLCPRIVGECTQLSLFNRNRFGAHSSCDREANFFVNNLLDLNLLCLTDSLQFWCADLHIVDSAVHFAAVFGVTIAIVWMVRRLVIAG